MMNVKKMLKQSVACISGGLLFGCTGSNSFHSSEKEGLSQERLFFNEQVFVHTNVKPTIPYPVEDEKPNAEPLKKSAVLSAIIGTIAPKLIDSTIDMVSSSIISLSGKDDETRSIGTEASNFFYKEDSYNMLKTPTPHLNLLFISAVFGDSEDEWIPKGLEPYRKSSFKALNIVGKPNFYMEVKVFPLPGNKYMEIVPTYIFYNKLFNSKGSDTKRDLAIDFSFYDLENKSDANLISNGNFIFRNVQVAKEYGAKELANVRTTFLEMPTISNTEKIYSGAYTLKVNVTETRDVNEWLADLGESISTSKAEIASTLYVTKEERIRLKEELKKAQIDVEMVEVKITEAKKNSMSEGEILKLQKELVEVQAKLEKLRNY